MLLLVVALVVESGGAWAACTLGVGTLTITSASTAYPPGGGVPAIPITFTVSYTNVQSTAAGGQCGNQTVVITPTPTGGTFAAATCNAAVNIPNNSGPATRTGACTINWTAPGAPAASYTVTATANDVARPIFNIATSNTLTLIRAGITVAGGGSTVTEAGATQNFSVVLTSQPSANVTVSVAADPATPDQCTFAPASRTFTNANWNVPQAFTVTAVNDAVVEGAHACTTGAITASATGGYTGATGTAPTFNITDNDTGTIIVATTDGAATETAGNTGAFTVRLGLAPSANVTVTIGVSSQCGFAPTPLTFTPANFATTQTVTVTPVDDAIVEGAHTCSPASITAAGGGYAGVTGALPTVNITDNDTSAVSIANTLNGTEVGPANGTMTVTLTNQSSTATTVSYTLGAGTATSGTDFTALPLTVVVPALTSTATITIPVLQDLIVEGGETVIVNLTAATSNPSILAAGSATNTIADDDLSNVTIANISDAAEPAINGVIRLTLSNPSATATTVTYTVAGSATAGTDYTALSGTALIPALATSFDIAVAVSDDLVVEGSETVDVTVTNVTGPVTLGASLNALNTIADDDSATVSIANTANGNEAGAASGTLTVTQTLASATDTVIALAYGGSATNVTDYGRPASVTIPAGLLNATITLTMVDDAIVEGAETVDVTISITSGLATAGAPLTATNTIADNDVADVSISNTLDGAEPATNGSLTVSQTAISVSDTVISYTIAGTAAAGGDYVALSGTVTILAGQLTATLDVTVLNDLAIEASETVIVTLIAVTSGLGTLSAAVVATNTIADDDTAISTAVGNAFKAQTHNFLVRRSDLITSHEPSIYRLANRDKGLFQTGSSGFTVVGENGNLTGDFAMNAKGVAHALEVASNGGATISPAADLVDSSSAFNAWLEGQFAIYRDDDAGQSQTGDFFVGYAGADWRVNEHVLLGVMGQIDWAEDRQANSINVVSGTGWMAGPYLSAEPVDNIFVDLRALWGQSDNSAIQDVLGSRYEGGFDTERWLVQAVIAGKHEAGDFDIAPEMSLIYMHESQESYSVTDGVNTVLVGGQSVDLGRLAGGVTISYQGEIGDAALEPYVGTRLLWDFENPGLMTVGGALASRDELRPQFKAGVNIRANASQLSLEATYDGLGSEGLDALTGKIMFSHSF